MSADIELPDAEKLEEHKRDSFSKRVALVTAVFAVILAITSLGGNNAMKELLLSQQQSSDQWSFYQSKVMREHLYRLESLKAEMSLVERGGSMKAPARQLLEKNARLFAAEEKRYNTEKREIEQAAKKLEAVRDIAQSRDPYFDYAEVLLQIAIVMSSISILAGSRPVLTIAVICASLGTILSINGFFLFFRLPFLH